MAGLAETRGAGEDSFWTWRTAMYRFALTMSPDDVAAVAAQAYAEMLESGFTTVAEFHYLHHAPDGTPYANPAEMAERIAEAADQTGIGLTLLPVFYQHGGFGGLPTEAGQRRFVITPDAYADLVARCRALPVRIGIAPHSLRAATPAHLLALAALAGDAPIHIHIAEQQREVADCLDWSGARPVQFLLDHAPVDRRWCLVHATHVTQAEVESIARSGAVVGLCPVTEANLGDGVMPAAALMQAGGAYGVGTDSNVRIGLADELCLLEYGQRLVCQVRNVMAAGSTGGTLFRAAVAGGAQAAGLGRLGLVAGAQADIVSLHADHPAMIGRAGDGLLDAWIFAARPGLVDAVWAAGRQVVTNGRHVHRASITARFRTVTLRLLMG
jgi:formiminoglutamate deiminase